MLRIAVVVVMVALASRAEAESCRLDRELYGSLMGTGGFGEALVCGSTKLDDVWVRIAHDGSITGIHWAEYQGAHKKRTIQLYDSGQLAFVVEDRSVKGGFWAQSRGATQFMFPRGGRMGIKKTADGLVVRDAAGHVWELVATKVPGDGFRRVSYVVAAIDRAPQHSVPISFAERGIVGIDLAATRTLYLERKEPTTSGMQDRRSRQYAKTRSIFHDAKGQTCAVANADLFAPNPRDPGDRSESVLRFEDDSAVAAFLESACPTLDVSALER